MTTIALHPSAITFTCPAWCTKTREAHLDDIGHHGGVCLHMSDDWFGALAGSSLSTA
jgi:hypothetical protein